jgi:hypothetical protein
MQKQRRKDNRKVRVKREVDGEEKCSECLRAVRLEERLERDSSRGITGSSMGLSAGSHGAKE